MTKQEPSRNGSIGLSVEFLLYGLLITAILVLLTLGPAAAAPNCAVHRLELPRYIPGTYK
jgi:hypothetical protein